MLTEDIKIIIDTINVTNKTISIAKDTIIKKDGIIIAKSRHRQAFAPGEIDKVKEYIGINESPEIDYLNAIWTQDVIDAYNLALEQS